MCYVDRLGVCGIACDGVCRFTVEVECLLRGECHHGHFAMDILLQPVSVLVRACNHGDAGVRHDYWMLVS